MCDSLNAQNIGCDTVVQGERETSQNEFSKIWIGEKSDLRLIEQQVCCLANLGFKTLTQTWDLFIVVHGGFDEFQLRFGVELQSHFLRRARRF